MSVSSPRPAPVKLPAAATALAVLGAAFIVFPLLALWDRVDFSRILPLLQKPESIDLMRVSLSSACIATVVCLVLGVPMALWLSRASRGVMIAQLLVVLPLALPPVVAGLALTAAIGRRGVLSPVLDAVGLQFAFAFPGVVVSHVFVALPFVVITVETALRHMDREVWHSSIGIGMHPLAVVTKVVLPTIAPAVLTGTGLAFARSLGEFGTTLTFAGSMPGSTRTLPIGIYLSRETDPNDAYALAAVLMLLALAVLSLAAVAGRFLTPRQPLSNGHVGLAGFDAQRLQALTRPLSDADHVLNVRTDRGAVAFAPRQITAVVGPNGAGKTTLLGMISGRLTGAQLRLGDEDYAKIPAHRRSCVVLTQRPGLPPQSRVADAITMATHDRERTEQLLEAAGLRGLARRRCGQLSGGQAAQVALLRAFASRPRIVLLDEPLAAVDVSSSGAWRSFLRASRADRTTIMVSHDPFDVSALASELVAMEDGAPAAAGRASELLEHPPTPFLAEFSGLNSVLGRVERLEDSIATLRIGAASLVGKVGRGAQIDIGDEVTAVFAPSSVTLLLAAEESSARNVWEAQVESLDVHGASTTVRVSLQGAKATLTVPITTRSALELGLETGTRVLCQVKAMSIEVF